VYNILESTCEVVLVNPRNVKNVPGRKTDVCDAEWLADLLRHGLIQGSFIPPKPIRDLRDVVRYRKTLVRERSSEVNRLKMSLEGMNIKLASVAADVLGVSGRGMLEAIASGCTDAQTMAEMAHGKLRKKIPELKMSLEGRVDSHHRFLLAQQLRHIDLLNELIEECNAKIDEMMQPFQEEVALLSEITGVGKKTAEAIIAEVGVDMSRFPSDKHIASWAGLCPGNNESAGKERGQNHKRQPVA
jgi:transposase